MEQQILEIPVSAWHVGLPNEAWIAALEAGKVLYFPNLAFALEAAERHLLRPDIRAPKTRNISLDAGGNLKGAAAGAGEQAALAALIGRFRSQAHSLIRSLLPGYAPIGVQTNAAGSKMPSNDADALRLAPTSFRPAQVETRAQSWRADDRRLHVDAFPSRPNYGERILRVFTNIDPDGVPRVWRIGEPFEVVAKHFLPRLKPYSSWQAYVLNGLRVTKSLRSEYDHLMLQLHDAMKSDLDYQQDAHQMTMPFPPGSAWVCFSDQTSHAVMSGQYMMEQTFHLPVAQQYDPAASPLAILTRLTGRALI